MSLLRLPAGERVPDRLNAVVETPMHSRGRYEYDLRLSAFRFAARLSPGVTYPLDYGFIPSTMSVDGFPLDVFLLGDEPTFPGCVIECRPVGLLNLTDGRRPDHKILAVPLFNENLAGVRDLPDVPPGILERLSEFLRANPLLSGSREDVGEWEGAEAAKQVIFLAWEGFL
ncbi:MAG: inorganic diphosphatase [Planctomycetes bacterium]|jgi:inorganic pyrophosphatase|nr:inorganic diphosphatase [Planctomycetota bacterium]